MSTSKRSTSKTKKPDGRSGEAKLSAKASTSAKAKPAAPAPKPRAKAAAPEPAKKSRTKKAAEPVAVAAAVTVAAPPAPPKRAAYSLDGPVPAEAAGMPKNVGALLGIGQQALGIKQFRPGQTQAFGHLLANEDLLAVMPTGSGKSLLYQLTSLVVPGVTVVVSPLIALIKDQIDKMVAKGVTAVRIDSTLTVRQRREVDALVEAPGGKLLLTTPERMADPEFRAWLRDAAGKVGVSRFVVDEAHCVSQWGHDFRPAYLSLRKALDDVGRPPVLATTATAPPHVRDDILFQLGIAKASIVTTTFDRPNLHYEVIVFDDESEKLKTLITLLKKLPRPGIVYAATVKKVEELHETLSRWGIPVARYHGRLNKKERDTEQQRFMDSNDLVMIATNAFGLGVDKQDVRNVIHYHVPGSLEAYAQEAGRGGRDGKPARCVLLFSPDDVAIQEYFLSGTYPTKRQVHQVYDAVEAFTELLGTPAEEDAPPTTANIALSSGVGSQRTRTVLSLLKDEKFIIEKDGGLFYLSPTPPDGVDLNERARQYEARRIADRQRLDALLAYVKAPGCRNQVILQYLGEDEPPRCGRCDNCLRSREAALAASTQATRLGASLTRHYDDDTVEKPKREIKARTVRIDQPRPDATAAPAPAPAPAVLRRAGAPAAHGTPPHGTPAVSNARGADRPPIVTVAPAAKPLPTVAKDAPAKPGNGKPGEPGEPHPGDEDLDDDDLEDDELDDEELEGDDDLDDDEDEGDDDDDEDDGDDLDDDEDDEDDDDDYEVIDKTAAELAEEGIEGPGEVTVLARKRVPKQPKQRSLQATDTTSASSAEARRRRRRRRRKRRAMLPPKSAFTTPVLSTTNPLVEHAPARRGGGGPVIEYVRGPMRIAMAPVASANPNDAGTGAGNRRRNKRFGRGGGGFDRRPDFAGGSGRAGARPQGDSARPGGNGNGFGASTSNGDRPTSQAAGDANGPDGRRRRRRRRRRGPGGDGQNPAPLGGNGHEDAPVRFFEPTGQAAGQPLAAGANGDHNGAPILGPDGLPLRKRRRRRRRGRGGRQREWRGAGAAPGGDGDGSGGDGGGGGGGGDGGAPPSSGGGDRGGGGSFSDGE